MEKVFLPKKTKIAARWVEVLAIIGMSGVLLIIILPLVFNGFERIFEEIAIWKYFAGIILGFVGMGFLLYSSFQLMRGRKWAWWVCVIYLLLISLINMISKELSLTLLIVIIPLILFILDRKNFWKIAT